MIEKVSADRGCPDVLWRQGAARSLGLSTGRRRRRESGL